MLTLEEIQADQYVLGIEPSGPVQIKYARMVGNSSLNVLYTTADGQHLEKQLSRADQAGLALAHKGVAWGFDADAAEFKLGAEALRIHYAHLFDPMMAVHTSDVTPLPHQISAVYEHMLQRQPLRFVLADDPGAGKTIMAGLLIRELMIRGDLERCLVVAPGGLVDQWQTELLQKFGVRFQILSRELAETSSTGNPFVENPLLIARLDQLARREDWHEKLHADGARWDLVIFDEAHKLSATFFGRDKKTTRRYDLGMLLGDPLLTRNLLLMTATPHNGKEDDFQLFMALVDRDRFHGRAQKTGGAADAADLMRRMVKEDLLKFDGTKLFPERIARTLTYALSPLEKQLYDDVTRYVRTEMGRAEKLDGQRKGAVGFALTILQRRLASSPLAIHRSLRRRRERLEKRLDELRRLANPADADAPAALVLDAELALDERSWDDIEDELSDAEREQVENQLVDQATAARTIPELEAEILGLRELERDAARVLEMRVDRKWEELSALLQNDPELLTPEGKRRKLIVFTEHRDTLVYLVSKIAGVLADPDAVVHIDGKTRREDRLTVQEQFRQNPDVIVLVATDAAGEGVNLQNANLMVNYDLPWNPNRLEQRFGRIHRIGQTEVCHLWNLVAVDTREGDVFARLFDKLETARQSLHGRVFDVLGEDVFAEQSLRDLLIEAIRYGEKPEVRARLFEKVDRALDTEHLHGLIERNALSSNVMSPEHLFSIKAQMEEAEARKLAPFYLRKFLMEAFAHLGGELREREPRRYEIRHVPPAVRKRGERRATRMPVMPKYERITFDREHIHVLHKPTADLMHPAHPLMAAVIDCTLERAEMLLKQGTVLVAPGDPSDCPRLLFVLEHTIRQGVRQKSTASQRMYMVEIDERGEARHPGPAPYLDYQPPAPEDRALVQEVLARDWLRQDLSALAEAYASEHLVQRHMAEVKDQRETLVDKTLRAVHERLVKEINHWSRRATELQRQVDAGKQPRMQPLNARRTAEELQARLDVRTRELEDQRHLASQPPSIRGGALIVPQGLVDRFHGRPLDWVADTAARKRVEMLAMKAVLDAEQALGYQTVDVSARNCGWDITSYARDGGETRHIEVKGRHPDARTITVTHNEVVQALNQGQKFLLAVVSVHADGRAEAPLYVRQPFAREPEHDVVSINVDLAKLLARARPAADA